MHKINLDQSKLFGFKILPNFVAAGDQAKSDGALNNRSEKKPDVKLGAKIGGKVGAKPGLKPTRPINAR